MAGSPDFRKIMEANSPLFAANASFVEDLYELYLADPMTVNEEWRGYFDTLQKESLGGHDLPHSPVRRAFLNLSNNSISEKSTDDNLERKRVAVEQLVNGYRFLGLRAANLDPLNRHTKPHLSELDPAYYGLQESDMNRMFEAGSINGGAPVTLRELLRLLRETYCGTIGSEVMYLSDIEQKKWLENRLESLPRQAGYDHAVCRRIMERLTAAETLERYLHTKYVGQKRFSLEGAESLIPLLDHLIQRAGAGGVKETVIGMAHRGRLNVLVNVLGKQPGMLFSEFEGKHKEHLTSGDVKYHQGFSSDISTKGGPIHVALAFNPSHLEIVNPVVEGSVRARQHRLRDLTGDQVLPVLLHGDAAFAGQGVVMETLNMSQTRGFSTGGTVHIIINNQIGFTVSDLRDTRSTVYCTDVAKMIEAPIFHVNGDDPEAVLSVTEIALDYRMKFHKDVVIDLVCFRKLGHNEQDEPLVTQPLMYRFIRKHPGTRKLYAERLIQRNIIQPGEEEEMILAYRRAMDAGHHLPESANEPIPVVPVIDWAQYRNVKWNSPAKTSVSSELLRELSLRLTEVPSNFSLHPRVQKIVEDRAMMGRGEMPLDWGMAETLAYATLLVEGFPIRLSGQDCQRGTFFHRHAAWHDQNRKEWNEAPYVPLQHLNRDQADFIAIDSLLSEEAVLGFEYGYATADPNSLVLWEAQFGDFVNGAQVVIDQFIAAGEVKWDRLCGLVMLLPHGYEGQGAEHSSGRIERFLQLSADYNIQVCVPSTPAQMFHLLRRQMRRLYRKPLIVFTPKSLLRSKSAASNLSQFTEGSFQPILSESESLEAINIRRIIVCSGKIYYELLSSRGTLGIVNMAIIRLEQLYPFPHQEFDRQLATYPNATEIVWVQEEPANQGAWHRIQHYLLRHLRTGMRLASAMRPSSAAPAVGYLVLHNQQQKSLIEAAFRDNLDL